MKNFDEDLKEMLNSISENIYPDENMLENIESKAQKRLHREENKMKNKFKFKVIIAAAAICLISVTGYAVGNISSWEGHATNETIPYEQVGKLEKKAGFEIQRVENFSNGFEYISAGNGKTKAYDDNGAVVGESKKVILGYEKDGKANGDIVLSARHIIAGEDVSIVDKYEEQKMVTFPGDAEGKVDEAEIEKYESEGYMISYGDGVEKQESTVESLYWTDGDLIYSMIGLNTNLGEEEFLSMKNEIME